MTRVPGRMRRANIKGALVGVEAVRPEGLKAVYKDFNYSGDRLIEQGAVNASLMLRKLGSDPGQNAIAGALRKVRPRRRAVFKSRPFDLIDR